ncbi:maleylpyruvate isomerase family mycothiol-dependent enzyme [Phytoactinopolyspora halophila]|nr:maleylpyruvate isomerase family mycothiol-dependent enzyme [Phytoactinopolyspora halophila]
MRPGLDKIIDDCRAAGSTLGDVVGTMSETQLREPSALPAWSRAHVLAHLTNVGDAAARQVEYAARGELVEFYDGGRAARDSAIEADSALGLADHQQRVVRMLERLAAAWPESGSPMWEQPVTFREGTVTDVALMWWREIRIHLLDVDLGVDVESWSEDFCRHLFDFLTPRLPAGGYVELRPDDSAPWRFPPASVADDETGWLVVRGPIRDVALWLAGRQPRQMPKAARDGQPVDLPELRPWPAARG